MANPAVELSSVPMAPATSETLATPAPRITLRELIGGHGRVITVAANAGIAAIAYVTAIALRFDLDIPPELRSTLPHTLTAVVGAKLVAFWATGLLRGWWRHVSIRDVEGLVRGNLLGSAFFLAVMVFGAGLEGFPRSVFVLDLILCTGAMMGLRVALRLVRERQGRPAVVRRIETLAVIAGAGAAGIRLLEDIESRSGASVGIVGFLDDDPGKQNVRIAGCPVLGRLDDLADVVRRYDVNEVLIAMPSAPGTTIRRVVQQCVQARVRHRVLPTLGELVDGRVTFTQMREVKVDDLLARAPVRLDTSRLADEIAGKTVLVTGAAGSIGSELCRQAAIHGPARLVLVDRHENGMFHLERSLRVRYPNVQLVPVLGDILLKDQLHAIFGMHRPELVLHAAAYKHVPLAEANVIEAVRNNVLGTRNLARAALAHGTRKFVLVSTDKAVRPSSVMGATKRAAELMIQDIADRRCQFLAVRFGNVLGSNGSVVPLFRDQIAAGGPVTVTDPNMTRFFMTIPEAAALILQSASYGQGGEIFVLEMGDPVRIVDLARQMIRLSGFEPDVDIPIVFTGLRPGEKLAEELLDEREEGIAPTYHDRIRVIRRQSRKPPRGWIEQLESCVRRGDVAAALRQLTEVVPGYQPSSPVADPAVTPSRVTAA